MKLIAFYGKTPQVALDKAKDKFGEDAMVVQTKFNKEKQLYQVDIITPQDDLNKDIEISNLKKELNNLKNQLNKTHPRILPNGELFESLKKTGIKEDILSEILEESLKYIPKEIKKSNKKMQQFFYKLLTKLFKTRDELNFVGKKNLMLVGPTGVGKTTTIAKIAAIASIIDYHYKVGIITLDSYRVGAVEQLNSYSKIMNLEMKSVDNFEKFNEAFREMQNSDLILIDTAGSSPKDNEKIAKIKNFLQNNNQNITINLVLSANTKYDDMLLAYEKFSNLGIESLIFTKLDETLTYGTIYSLIFKIEKPVSYFCIGQEVPNDIIKADGKFLIKNL